MNDDAPDLPTPSPEFDAVAAVLDGNATPDDQALVDASPALQALLADLAADKAAIADVSDIEITTEVREWSIAAALGAYDQFLGIIGDEACRAELKGLRREDAKRSATFMDARRAGEQLQDALLALLFETPRFTQVARAYSVF